MEVRSFQADRLSSALMLLAGIQGVGICENLNNTNIIALSGSGDSPTFSPRQLILYNTTAERKLIEKFYPTQIEQIRINSER